MKASIFIAILSLGVIGSAASASDCTADDHAQIMAGLTSRSTNQNLSVGERDLANLVAGSIRKQNYQSCVKNVVSATGDTVFLISTPELAASIEFAGSSVISIQAGSL